MGGGGVGEDVGTLVLNMYIGNTISNVMVKIDAEIDPQQRGTTDFFLCVCVYTCSSFYLCNTRVTGRAKRRKKGKTLSKGLTKQEEKMERDKS